MPKWLIVPVSLTGIGAVITVCMLLKSWDKRKNRQQKADIKNQRRQIDLQAQGSGDEGEGK